MNRKKTPISSLTGNQLYSPSPNPSFGRNLTKDQLGGVIFGCKNATIQECLTKQLFGLPAVHFSYVKNIHPGLPLFLFNYSDRTIHGIFEAAGNGRMYIDRYGWTDGSDVTQFPAQVQTRLQLRCRPLTEEKFKHVIAENYYVHNHFWFELDHGQTSRLIGLLKPLAIAPAISSKPLAIAPANSSKPLAIASQNTNLSQSLPWHDPSWKSKTFKIPESKSEEHHSTRSSLISCSDSDLLDECFKPLDTLDTHSTDKEESAQNEKDLVWRKLKELAVARENQNLCWDNNVTDTPYADENWSDEKHSEEKEDNPSYPSEKEENFSHPSEKEENFSHPSEKEESFSHPSEKEENSSSQFEHQFNIAQLMQEIKALADFKTMQAEKNNSLEQKLKEAESQIQLLKDRCALLESTRDIPPTHVEETLIDPIAELHLDARDSFFLIGGSDGESPLAAMDMYCTSQNVIKSLKPMSCLRSYASVVELNGEIYVFGGGDDCVWFDSVESYNPIYDNWTLCPSMNRKKGSLSGAALDGKIFAVGGGNGTESFSEVEMLDFDVGRWIPTRSMLDKRFALAAVELNGAIYATGGYDGKYYLNSAERFDPREHAWSKIANMNTKRGCHALVVIYEKL
ncbi:DCD (Development and Cell Death) domain protein [Trifolium repens]|nr:DCD (Development and Cell Death) domain protein [Trifolium repens]